MIRALCSVAVGNNAIQAGLQVIMAPMCNSTATSAVATLATSWWTRAVAFLLRMVSIINLGVFSVLIMRGTKQVCLNVNRVQ